MTEQVVVDVDGQLVGPVERWPRWLVGRDRVVDSIALGDGERLLVYQSDEWEVARLVALQEQWPEAFLEVFISERVSRYWG